MNIEKRHPLQALLIGREEGLLWILPSILSRAGFAIDILTSASIMKSCQFVSNCEILPRSECIVAAAARKCNNAYDWIIVTEDGILQEVLQSNLPLETKLKLLPVMHENNFPHLHSKIGLSEIFSKSGINTPPYRVVTNIEEASAAADQLEYPVLLKIDASGGGFGVYECHNSNDIKAIDSCIWLKPLLMQKKIEGVDLDLSALHMNGELIHFSYSRMEKVTLNKFGPSSLRTYHSLPLVDKKIFNEIREIGKVLGAHGFSNITCIEASNGSGRYYIEADMRPNVWVDTPRFFGEELAKRIYHWHLKGETLQHPVPISEAFPAKLLIPYFLRLSLFELLINRYNAWKYIPKDNRVLICKLLLKKVGESLSQYSLKNIVKRLTPKKHHKFLKEIYLKFKTASLLKKTKSLFNFLYS